MPEHASLPENDSAEYRAVATSLLNRWPETRLEPSLDRIRALTEALGNPQHAYPVVHLTGTNGKTSTSRMIDSLLSTRGLRTGRFTSPHVESMTERISLDGAPIDPERFVAAYQDVAPFAEFVEADSEHPISFFEYLVAMGFAAFADAPVDVAVVEVGMGGSWDATNVADAQVAVMTPIAVDHAKYLGDTAAEIAVEKAGIIKPGCAVVVAEQTPEVMAVLSRRAREVGVSGLFIAGIHFGVISRTPAVGGQLVSFRGLRGDYLDVFLPLYGAHQAENAALALAACEAFSGDTPLDVDLVTEAFAQVTSPGRLEVVRRGPTIVLDAAHNPHGAQACVEALHDSFRFDPLVGVLAVMADKDVEGLLAAFEPVFSEIVCTQNSTPRCLPADELAQLAAEIYGEHRVRVEPRLDDALDVAVTLAETGGAAAESLSSGGVLVTGSVVTVGEARTLLTRKDAR